MENIETIDDIINKKFFIRSDYLSVDKEETEYKTFSHVALCDLFRDTDYELLWLCYWNHINTKKYPLICAYFGMKFYSPIGCKAFLRLLILEDFKKFCEIKA